MLSDLCLHKEQLWQYLRSKSEVLCYKWRGGLGTTAVVMQQQTAWDNLLSENFETAASPQWSMAQLIQ